jgi:hypothetical protein
VVVFVHHFLTKYLKKKNSEGQINTWFEILDAYDFEIERRTSHHMEMLMQCHRDLFRINIAAIVAGLSNDVR